MSELTDAVFSLRQDWDAGGGSGHANRGRARSPAVCRKVRGVARGPFTTKLGAGLCVDGQYRLAFKCIRQQKAAPFNFRSAAFARRRIDPGHFAPQGPPDGLAAAVFSKPDGSVAAIIGADGNGKSWLFAQAWTHQTPRPLTIIIMPDDVNTPFAIESLQELLITKLLAQTGETRSEASVARWRSGLF